MRILLATAVLGGVVLAMSRQPRRLSRSELDTELSARFGPLKVLRWSDVVYLDEPRGVDVRPGAVEAERIRSLDYHVLGRVRLPWRVVEGYRRHAMHRTCPLGGHEEGHALCLRVPGWTSLQVAHAVYAAATPVGRIIVAGDHVHLDTREKRQGIEIRTADGAVEPIRMA